MRPFSSILKDGEIAAVSAYILRALMQCSDAAVHYHTAGNGWPDHAERNGAAFPFVQGEVPVDRPEASLTPSERVGLDLFKRTCSICHEGVTATDDHHRDVRHKTDHPEEGNHGAAEKHHDEEYNREYGEPTEHDLSPEISDLSPLRRTGRDLYLRNCALCHAADGSGRNWIGSFLDPSPPSFTDPAAALRLDNTTLRQVILGGRANTSMPAFRSVLEADQVEAIVAYLRRAFLTTTP